MINRKITSSLAALTVSLCLVLLLIFEKTATNEAAVSLSIVAKRVIPTLFPFMVISDIIVSGDLLQPLYSLIPTEKIFRLPRCTASVILCGLLCGFPIGASGAARLYSDKKISQREAEVPCAISSHASPAFTIGVVGGIWGSKRTGVLLYFAEVIYCLISGAILSRITLPPLTDRKTLTPNSAVASSFISSVCGAVHSSSITCLSAAGNIVFFRVLGAVMSVIIPPLASVFAVVFEFSGGAVYGAGVGRVNGGFLTGFAVGFSGLAVLLQCCNFTAPHGIKMNCYILTKTVEGLFLGTIAAILVWCNHLIPAESTFIPITATASSYPYLLLCFLAAIFLLTRPHSKRNNFTHGS